MHARPNNTTQHNTIQHSTKHHNTSSTNKQTNEQVAEYLLDEAPPSLVNICNKQGYTALNAVCTKAHVRERKELIALLIERKADTEKAAKGTTPLISAAFKGNEEVVDQLLSLGADVNAVNKNGNSALHLVSVLCFYLLSGLE